MGDMAAYIPLLDRLGNVSLTDQAREAIEKVETAGFYWWTSSAPWTRLVESGVTHWHAGVTNDPYRWWACRAHAPTLSETICLCLDIMEGRRKLSFYVRKRSKET